MSGKNQEYVYYLITHNGGKPKEFDELYFDYIDEFQTDEYLKFFIDELIKLKKIQLIYFNPYTSACNKIKSNDDERQSYMPQYDDANIKKMLE